MKVTCKDAKQSGFGLIKNKEYDVQKEDEWYYWVISEHGVLDYFYKDRFKKPKKG